MEVVSNYEFSAFLTTKPLYSKITTVKGFVKAPGRSFSIPSDFKDLPFNSVCPFEKSIQTFKTIVSGNDGFIYRDISELTSPDKKPMFFDENGFLHLVIHLVGVCQACGEHIDFLLKIDSTKSWEDREQGFDIIVQKIGQYPPFDIKPDTRVEKYLTAEDLGFYKKALANFSISYGIGAFSYLRRVLENEIDRIIVDISSMDFDGVKKVRSALEKYNTDHQKENLIQVLNDYLPSSLKQFGDNPIKLLYKQLSVGIHSLSDEECLEKAESINIILTYVIQKIYEEKTESGIFKEAMTKLRNNQL